MSDNLPLRMKSQRLVDKAIKQQIEQQKISKESQTLDKMELIQNPVITDLYPGLNEITDALQAFPYELIRYFTLLKEIDAKCVNTVPYLRAYIIRFIQMKKTHPKRELLLSKIRDLIKELMPCLEEKMHVATIASDTVNKNIRRINQAYEIVVDHEIPEIIRVGPMNHPAMTVINEPKSAQSQRSESRREALAAKKAAAGLEDGFDSRSATPMPTANGSNNNNNSLNINGAGRSFLNNGNGPAAATATSNSSSSSSSRKPKGSSKEGGATKKRKQANNQESYDDNNGTSISNGTAGGAANDANGVLPPAKKKQSKPRKDRVKKEENTANGNGNSNGANGSGHSNGNSGDKSSNGNAHNGGINPKSQNSANENHGTHNSHAKSGNGGGRSSNNGSKNTVNEPSTPPSYDGEPVYCYCQQVSYGEMVGCDGESCEKEWFHLPCTGLKELPTGEWYCDDCKSRMKKK